MIKSDGDTDFAASSAEALFFAVATVSHGSGILFIFRRNKFYVSYHVAVYNTNGAFFLNSYPVALNRRYCSDRSSEFVE